MYTEAMAEKACREQGTLKTTLRQQWRRRRIRVLLILLIGLWIAAGTKYLTERIYLREESLREAFSSAVPGETAGTLEFAATYGNGYLTEKDKEELIRHIAARLGITVTEAPMIRTETDRSELIYEKHAKRAVTIIKLVSIPDTYGINTHYITVHLEIANDTEDSLLYYRDLLLEVSTELGAVETQVSLLTEGQFDGNLTLSERNALADRMLQKLNCKIVSENRESDVYTIYAYTYGMKEYIESDGERINVQLAMYYDENLNVTVVYLASPMINGTW